MLPAFLRQIEVPLGKLPKGRKFGFTYGSLELALREVTEGTQAYKHQLQQFVGYTIHKVNGKTVTNGKEYVRVIDSLPIGTDVTFTLQVRGPRSRSLA